MNQMHHGTATSRGSWGLLALPAESLETADLVALNLTVAKEIPRLADLDIASCQRVVDAWTEQFGRWLAQVEPAFNQTPWKWKSDRLFFRLGMLMQFLDQNLGIRYREDQKQAKSVRYTNPADLFLNGLIDTRIGTCANMPVLHVAMGRRLGWPVSLACVKSHFVCRFEDDQVVYNIECTDTGRGGFAAGSDEDYIRHYKLPPRAISSGSDLRKLSAREMLGIFISLRARHYWDIEQFQKADADYALARAIVPSYRRAYASSLLAMLTRGDALFDRHEEDHPRAVFERLVPGSCFVPDVRHPMLTDISLLSLGGSSMEF